MSIDQLSTELLQRIYEFSTIEDVINFSKTTKKNHNAYLGSQKHILRKAIYNSPYSPIPELVKLVISGEPDNIRKPLGTELRRGAMVDRVISSTKPSQLSVDFIKKMIHYGKIAERWTEIYPQLRWRYDSSNRRLLRPIEAERVRKAIYQIWTYHNLFHDKTFCEFSPDIPRLVPALSHRTDLRFRLARTWSTIDIIRQSEFMDKMRQVMEIDIFPSNEMVQYSFNETVPDKMLAKLAWGEERSHRPFVDTLLKLTPDDMLYLYHNTTSKQERLQFLLGKGQWFYSKSSSFNATIYVLTLMERCHGHPPVQLPSCSDSLRFGHVFVEDENVKYGIVDNAKPAGRQYLHLKEQFSNDGVPNGEWVEPDFADLDQSEWNDSGSDDDEE